MSRLVVVSNRIAIPDGSKASAGGLAVGILDALKTTGGLWFGWDGEISAVTVAEAIETNDQLLALQQLGVSLGQGYFLGRPQSTSEINRWVRPGP